MKSKTTRFILDKLQKSLMFSGSKLGSSLILKEVLRKILKKKKNPLNLIFSGVDQVKPFFLVKTQKKGRKKKVQIPVPLLTEESRLKISSNWIVNNSSKHSQNFVSERLIQELVDSSTNQGFSKKQQQDLNKLVIQNRSSL